MISIAVMSTKYTDEKNAQIIIALLKAHRIRRIIASPGSTNIALIGSVQNDPFFEVYSSVDERSAAYMACGMAAELREPVVISCTGATASRNYLPGLTEAFYRKLPILAITSTLPVTNVGHHVAQVIDRGVMPRDVARLSVTLPIIKDDEDFFDCEVKVNQAILELKRNGGGPVHINLPTEYSGSFTTSKLPEVRIMERFTPTSKLPELPKGRIAVFVGSHTQMSAKQTAAIDAFCEANNAVVFCDHSSGYRGAYRVLYSLVASQQLFDKSVGRPGLLIHIGEISGDYPILGMVGKEVWRVSEDGELRDTMRKMTKVFEMPEDYFFEQYHQPKQERNSSYLELCNSHLSEVYNNLPELPFSNVWVASKMAPLLPDGATVHLGILNSLRAWNFFEFPESVTSASNVGGFGIDGNSSSLIGASLTQKSKLYFGVFGDLAFFYDMNALGNRHIGNNLRILLVNNGKGTEFRRFDHSLAVGFGEAADEFISAAGHFGNKSPLLVKHYATDLGFEYLSASDKESFYKTYKRFLTPEVTERPMVFEVFTTSEDESEALKAMTNILTNTKGKAKQIIKKTIGDANLNLLKRVLK